jgi:hypothetical protein
MRKVTPYFANGSLKACWNCGEPLIGHQGRAEATVGHDNRLYCYRIDCEHAALVPLVRALQRESVFQHAA